MTMLKSIIILLISYCVFAHGGRTKTTGELKGCHNQSSNNSFHCHSKSHLNGRSFKSESEAIKSLSKTFVKTVRANNYHRDKFKHWIDSDRDCLDTRAETLKSRSLKPVTIKKCRVTEGEWKDFYYNEKLYLASEIDIDHIVPLKEAWITGANLWTSKKRREFANDPRNLVITKASYNRSKGAKTPLEWLPVNKEYACRYISMWLEIKRKYSLKISNQLVSQHKSMRCN